MTEQRNPVRATTALNMVYGRAFRRGAARAGPAVVIKHLITHLPSPAALRLAPLLLVRRLPSASLLPVLLRVRLPPPGRLFLDPLRVRCVVAAAGLPDLLWVGLRPTTLSLSIFHTRIVREATFDDVPQGVRKRMREIAVLEFDGPLIASLREYWASESLGKLETDG